MKQNTKRTLNDLVQSHLYSIVASSLTISRHSKRPRQNNSILTSNDVLTALQLEGVPLQLPTNAGFTDTTPIDLNSYLETDIGEVDDGVDEDEGIQPPSEVGMTMHWLAVEGKQPAIPLNPPSAYRKLNIIEEDENSGGERGGAFVQERIGTNSDIGNGSSNSVNVAVWNLMPRLLSEDLQLYFTRITLALERNDPQAQDAALLRLKYDSGIQELVPFFLSFLTPQKNIDMADVERSRLRIRCVHNLILNQHVHLELHLQQILPMVLNCIVPRKLSFSPYDHWVLRDEASRILLAIWNVFGEKYAGLKSGVIRELIKALSHGLDSHGLGSCYGALVALSGFGPKVVDSHVLPVVAQFWVNFQVKLELCQDNGIRFGLHRLQDALLYGLSVFLGSGAAKQAEILDKEQFSEVFGDQLVPFCGNVTNCEYFECFV